jgi:hypothetical protein
VCGRLVRSVRSGIAAGLFEILLIFVLVLSHGAKEKMLS